LGQAMLQDPKDLDLLSCHTQATWVWRPFPAPNFLGLEGNPLPKIIVVVVIIDFVLQINSMFFFDSNDIYFKFNNIKLV